jgi:lysyl-tRNA synthetase, class II
MDLEEVRKKKLEALQAQGINAYPAKVWRTHTCQQAVDDFEHLLNQEIVICGRLKTIRAHGKSAFANLEDGSGVLQIYLKQDLLGQDKYKNFQELIDLGDFIEARGNLTKTHSGEKTLILNNFRIISKALLPMPEKWHGLEDVEIRYRQRYLDLMSNQEVKDIFLKRAAIIKAIRKFFDQEGFLSVETPVLQALAGGATAKPFKTHHDALDIGMYLSIAPELYLKRLIIGGFDKVYEIARCFRNEGIDWSHNPEFSQIEFYQAYADYQDLMDLTERFFTFLFKEINLDFKIKYRDQEINFQPPYPRKKYVDAVKEYAGIDLNQLRDQKDLFQAAKKLGVEVEKNWSWAKIVDEIFKEKVRSQITDPVFIMNHPIELSPLAKKTPDDPNYVERFQLVVAGFEACNAFSELNDPLDQEERFKGQQAARKGGDEEAQMNDADFVEALKHGMPPTAGMGLGIERLVMLLTGAKNIREVILFPTLKPKSK